MFKLLTAYIDNPSLKNADRLRDYDRKHPMACVVLTREQGALLNNAIQFSLTCPREG